MQTQVCSAFVMEVWIRVSVRQLHTKLQMKLAQLLPDGIDCAQLLVGGTTFTLHHRVMSI